jgi:hypothetical protein
VHDSQEHAPRPTRPRHAAAKRVFDAMMSMTNIDIANTETARHG